MTREAAATSSSSRSALTSSSIASSLSVLPPETNRENERRGNMNIYLEKKKGKYVAGCVFVLCNNDRKNFILLKHHFPMSKSGVFSVAEGCVRLYA